jgi:hypothetical protein
MDNVAGGKPSGIPGSDKPIPLATHVDKPIPLDSGVSAGGAVSRAPLTLGGAPPATPAQPQPPRLEAPKITTVPKAAPVISTGDRICGVKTFFTKLHPGAIKFLEEQITLWLQQNPAVRIKSTNVTVGEVQEKKTEPNLIITVWY